MKKEELVKRLQNASLYVYPNVEAVKTYPAWELESSKNRRKEVLGKTSGCAVRGSRLISF
ncbi:MAG: hypothetical protein ACTSXC_06290 [Candidatus Freyarchaeota archaeon]